MPEERKSGARGSDLAIEISDLVRSHGITRDQARRLINRIGKNRAKLDRAARILKARFSQPGTHEVDVLDRSLAVTQPSSTQSGLEPPGVAIGGLAVEQ